MVEINDQSNETYGTNSQIKFKNVMLNSSLCDYSKEYILVKRTITITGAGANAAAKTRRSKNKGLI